MYPELFEIPLIHLTVKSYGLMMVVGFLSAVYVIRRLSRNITPDPQLITNAALYSLIAGVVGARLFYVIHYLGQFRGRPFSVFAIWEGGLELLGGVILAIAVIFFYLWWYKLPIRRYLDILAIGLMLALVFGRIGCFLNGCCFGKTTDLPWGVRFPYGSPAYRSQAYPDLDRGRHRPLLELPGEFFGYSDNNGVWHQNLKPYAQLTLAQKEQVVRGPYRCLPVHPTQLYSSANAGLLCVILYFFWQRYQGTRSKTAGRFKKPKKLFGKPGSTFSLMFILYGSTRFLIEFVRDDNPLGFAGLTVSQRICIMGLIPLGVALMVIFERMKGDKIGLRLPKQAEVRAEAEERAWAKAEEKAAVEARARAEAEEKARVDVEAKAEAQAWAGEEAGVQTEEIAKAEAEEKAAVEAKARAEAEERARVDAEARAEAQARAEEDGGVQAEERAEAEAEEKAVAEAKARAEGEEEAGADAEAKTEAKAIAEEDARVQAEEGARAEAKAPVEHEGKAKVGRKAGLEVEKRGRAKVKREVRGGAEKKARAKAEPKVGVETEGRAKSKGEKTAEAEGGEKTRTEAKAKAEAEESARAEPEAKAKVERKSRVEAEKRARAEAKAKAEEKARPGAEARSQRQSPSRRKRKSRS